MRQAVAPVGPSYAVRLMPGEAPGTRVARAKQSAAAAALLAALREHAGIPAGSASKSHTRALVAAAFLAAGRVGIDAEYMAPGRDIRAVARFLMGGHARDAESCYRVFTFREAYFKAIGDWPERALLRRVAEETASHFVLSDLGVLQERVDDFALTLVWIGGGEATRIVL